jgi:hypothetical protein
MQNLNFKIIETNNLFISNVNLSKSLIIKPIINNIDLIEKCFDNDALFILDEWRRSSIQTGKYLLFTSLIGIADDGGWEMVRVNHVDDYIQFSIIFNDTKYDFNFNKIEYQLKINELVNDVSILLRNHGDYRLQPINYDYPENFNP